MYEHTPNLKHTIANKGSIKALYRFIQIEMKEHDCYLANWSCLKGSDNQDNLATWQEIFQRSSSPTLEFCKAESCLDDRILMCECDSMLKDNWFILFASILEWSVTKIPEGIFSQLCFYAYFTKVS